MGFFEALVYYGGSVFKVVLVFGFSVLIYSWYGHRRRMGFAGRERKLENWEIILCRVAVVLPVALMVGLRSYMTGADSDNMYKYYLATLDTSLFDWLRANFTSVLYDLVRWLCCRITGGNVQVFLFLLAFVTLYLVVAAIDNWKLKYRGTALAIYYCLFGLILFDQSRQMLAMAVLMYAFKYAYKRQPKKYIPLVITAGLIHITAFIAGAAVLFLTRRKHFKNRMTENLVYIGELVLICVLVPVGISLIGVIFEGTKYEKYAIATGDGTIGLGFFLALLPTALPAVLLSLDMDKQNRMRDNILMVIPTRYAGYTSTFVSRMSYYFSGVCVFAFPYAIQKARGDRRRFYQLMILVCCVVYFILWYWWKNAYIYLPYMTFWELPYPG